MLLRSMATNEFSYVIRPLGVAEGSTIYSFPNGIPPPVKGQEPIPKTTLIQPGNCLQIKDIPIGSFIHCIGLVPKGPGILCRSAGTSAQIMSMAANGFAQIKLSSKEVRLIHGTCIATIGKVANELHKFRNWGKAGARRRKGWRPQVRGNNVIIPRYCNESSRPSAWWW
jgi:ribosomal protein L2